MMPTQSRRAGDFSRRRWALRLGIAAVMAAVVAYLPYRLVGGSSGNQLDRMRDNLARTRETIRSLRGDNAEREREVDALKNDAAAVEEIARRELGMVRSGELVLRIERPK